MDIEERLSHIYTDMLMLESGEWKPDEGSCQATIINIEELAEELKINIEDLRTE